MPAFASALGLLLATQALAAADPTEESRVERSPRAAHRARGREPRRGALDAHAVREPAHRGWSVRDPPRGHRSGRPGSIPPMATTGCSSSRSSRASSSTRSESRSRSSRRPACAGTATSCPRRLMASTIGMSSAGRCGSSRAICSEAASTSTSAASTSRTIAAGGGTRSSMPCASRGRADPPSVRRVARRRPGARPRPFRSTSPRRGRRGPVRVLGTLSWEFAANHGLDCSRSTRPITPTATPLGASVRASRVDEADARLFWLGPRALGAFDLGVGPGSSATGSTAVWVRGDERIVEYGDPEAGSHRSKASARRDVSGWAFDLGLLGIAPRATRAARHARLRDRLGRRWNGRARPRLSPERSPGQRDRLRRCPALPPLRSAARPRALEPRRRDGRSRHLALRAQLARPRLPLLPPDPSRRFTAQLEHRDALRRATPRGRARLDLVLAIEEGDRFELELSGSLFRAGSAFGPRRGEWAFGGLAALRVAF